MSEKFEGFVKVVNKRDGVNSRGAWFVESFKLVASDGKELEPWFQFDFNVKVPFQKDEYVSFDAESGEYGFTVVPGTGRKVSNPPSRSQQARTSSGGSNTSKSGDSHNGTSDNYWKNKTAHELENVEPRIRYTSARNFALEFVTFLADQDALPSTGAKTKAGQASREEEIAAIVDKYTVKYYGDVQTLRLLDTIEDAGNVKVNSPDVTYDDVEEQTQAATEENFDDDIPF